MDSWVALYDDLVHLDDLDELRENGHVYYRGTERQDEAEALRARCQEAGITAVLTRDFYYGWLLSVPVALRPLGCGDGTYELRRQTVERWLAHASSYGHRSFGAGRRDVGVRSVCHCPDCGGRLYVDVARDLACGELTEHTRCPGDSEATHEAGHQ
jgi:hypothetical protein